MSYRWGKGKRGKGQGGKKWELAPFSMCWRVMGDAGYIYTMERNYSVAGRKAKTQRKRRGGEGRAGEIVHWVYGTITHGRTYTFSLSKKANRGKPGGEYMYQRLRFLFFFFFLALRLKKRQ